jgi:hypothetical protein
MSESLVYRSALTAQAVHSEMILLIISLLQSRFVLQASLTSRTSYSSRSVSVFMEFRCSGEHRAEEAKHSSVACRGGYIKMDDSALLENPSKPPRLEQGRIWATLSWTISGEAPSVNLAISWCAAVEVSSRQTQQPATSPKRRIRLVWRPNSR